MQLEPLAVTLAEWEEYTGYLRGIYPTKDESMFLTTVIRQMLEQKVALMMYRDQIPGLLAQADEVLAKLDEGADFERILRMVLLSRLLDGRSRVTLAEPTPVRLETDEPREANSILGRDRAEHCYHVIDVEREGEARLRLFVHTGDSTVRKAIQFDADDPGNPRWHYYFGPFQRQERELGLNLPRYVSMHDGFPDGKEGRARTTKLYGMLKVRLNTELKDGDLKP